MVLPLSLQGGCQGNLMVGSMFSGLGSRLTGLAAQALTLSAGLPQSTEPSKSRDR